NSGSNRTFTITPNSSYKISGVLVDGISVGAPSSYTFTNVTANRTISASFASIPGTGAPTITSQPVNQTVSAGQTATFSTTPAGALLTYQWQKNGANIAGATGASYTTPATVTADSGSTFRCVISNSAGSATSNVATLTVNTANHPPSISSAAAA